MDPGLFLHLAGEIRTHNAAEWLPLWKDITKHAPQEVRTEPACLAALAAWCAGDGASAWSALDRIPADVGPDHPVAPVAQLLRQSLQSAAHPRTWDQICEQTLSNPSPQATASASSSRHRPASARGRGDTSPGLAR